MKRIGIFGHFGLLQTSFGPNQKYSAKPAREQNGFLQSVLIFPQSVCFRHSNRPPSAIQTDGILVGIAACPYLSTYHEHRLSLGANRLPRPLIKVSTLPPHTTRVRPSCRHLHTTDRSRQKRPRRFCFPHLPEFLGVCGVKAAPSEPADGSARPDGRVKTLGRCDEREARANASR